MPVDLAEIAWQASSAEDVERLACIAATHVAQDLRQRGFDHTEADGPNVLARRGNTTWRVVNRLTYQPGVRAELLTQFDAAMTRALITPSATESRH